MAVRKPESKEDWERVIGAARYLMIGFTIAESADMVGVSKRTVSRWRTAEWWSSAMREAATVEFKETAAKALGVIKQKIEEGDATTARWYLSKVHPILGDNDRKTTAQLDRDDNHNLSHKSDRELRLLAAGKEPDYIDTEWEELDDDLKDFDN